jgi:hypothetical protein
MTQEIFIFCPHCGQACEILELNCRIFRCGVFKGTMLQLDPHAPKQVCDALVSSGQIHGCGKPFKALTDASGAIVAVVCDYI